MCFALTWAGLSLWIAGPWVDDLSVVLGPVIAYAIIFGIAIVPGYLNAHLFASLVFDRPPPLTKKLFDSLVFPSVTVLIAAYNEAGTIEAALAALLKQTYPGELNVLVVDDGSEDETRSVVSHIAAEHRNVKLLSVEHGGKALALNAGLEKVSSPIVVTVDADTRVAPDSLRRIVARFLVCSETTVAVAGAVLVDNWEHNLISKIQEWDYLMGIASIKREQALWQGALVAQGSFSAYDTDVLRSVGGWPDMIGEDIVLTWKFMNSGGTASYEVSAVALTQVPVTFFGFFRQRRRWARGMVEGLKTFGPELLRKHKLYSHAVLMDFAFPYVDFVFTFAFLPGIVLALTGNFMIVGPITLLVIPLSLVIWLWIYLRQRMVLHSIGMRMEGSVVGLALFLLFFQIVSAPISVVGYFLEVVRAPRKW